MFELSQRKRAGILSFLRQGSQVRVWEFLRRNWSLIFLALPGVTLVFLLKYIPLFGSIVAFEDFQFDKGFFSPWVGLKNFKLLWGSPVLVRLVRNTVLLNVMFIASGTFFAVLIALLLNEVSSKGVRRMYQWVMFLPFFMGWSLVAMVLYGLIDYEVGTFNMLLKNLGLERIALMNKAKLWPWLLTLIHVWKGTGSGCIVYLAVLVGINPELYEAASIDGAGRLQRIWYISLPSLFPTMVILTLLAIGRIFFGNWGMIYALVGNNALLYPTTDVIDTYILRALQSNVNFGMSAAVGLSQSLLGFILVWGTNRLARKYFDYSLF